MSAKIAYTSSEQCEPRVFFFPVDDCIMICGRVPYFFLLSTTLKKSLVRGGQQEEITRFVEQRKSCASFYPFLPLTVHLPSYPLRRPPISAVVAADRALTWQRRPPFHWRKWSACAVRWDWCGRRRTPQLGRGCGWSNGRRNRAWRQHPTILIFAFRLEKPFKGN